MASSLASPGHVQMQNDWEYQHGRIDPGQDASVDLVESVPAGKEAERVETRQIDTMGLKHDDSITGVGTGFQTSTTPHAMATPPANGDSHLMALPSELIDAILSFLSPLDLIAMSSACRELSAHAKSDLSWQRHVQENIPGLTLTSPSPCKTFRELYRSHDPHWFIPRYKIWFCDYFLTGKVIIARYDPRRGCIEGYRLVAERPPPAFEPWEANENVVIHSFEPRCRLHMDQPVLQLDALSLESLIASSGKSSPAQRFCAETPMLISSQHRGLFSNFLLTRPVASLPHTSMQVWPPLTIPTTQRVRNASQEAFVGAGHKPQKRSEVSDQAFRIRRWMEMAPNTSTPGLHLGEEVYTYATLSPHLYTPTELKPYRGIWVGDYSGHGCEFLLLHQPDDEEPFDESKVIQEEDETTEEWEKRKKEERIYRGSLEAIKLTGDPNVPRGEYTFISDDIGKGGFVRTATEKRFEGARIVKSRGHIAANMFRNDKYIESQLIMISHNRLAQYWLGFGHISFYERVDIDSFLSPFDDPEPGSGSL